MPDYHGKEHQRWYSTARWQRIRATHLQQHPLCVFHAKQGQVVAATICDHIEPHRGDPVKFWTGPFQSLCKSCHDSVKQAYEKTGRVRITGIDGFPIDLGLPPAKPPRGW